MSDSERKQQVGELESAFLTLLKQHSGDLSTELKAFHDLQRSGGADTVEMIDRIVGHIDSLTADNAEWEASDFLASVLRPMVALRDRALHLKSDLEASAPSKILAPRPITEKEAIIYVSIFQSQGGDLKQWALQLGSLKTSIAGRPVYANEADVCALVKHKESALSESYLCIAVDKKDILTQDARFYRQDHLGHRLLILKQTAIKEDNILEFVHNKKRYLVESGRLIEQMT
jgi:Dot/Icm secretion system protein IcmQ